MYIIPKIKVFSKFGKDFRYRFGVKGWCKFCETEYGRTPKAKRQRKRYRNKRMRSPEYREFERRRSRKKYWKDPAKAKDRILRKLYGISLKKFQRTKRCLLCRRKVERLVADHCHETNKYRGVLCVMCNLMVAWIERIPSALQKVKQYLRRG